MILFLGIHITLHGWLLFFKNAEAEVYDYLFQLLQWLGDVPRWWSLALWLGCLDELWRDFSWMGRKNAMQYKCPWHENDKAKCNLEFGVYCADWLALLW